MDNQFRITVPCYNASQYIAECLNSIKNQSYKQFKCCFVDDCSTDNSYRIAVDTIGSDDRFSIIKNENRRGALYNIKKAINAICPEDEKKSIIVNIDGDDSLASNDVLEFLDKTYRDNPNVWLTYGEYQALSGAPSQNAPISDTKKYRKSGIWCTSHLRTYKKFLWDRIQDNDLKDANGNFFKIAPDLVIIYPMIEMCGLNRLKFINNKILYRYNDLSPICEFKVNPQLLGETRAYIESRGEYAEIIGEI